MKTETKVFAVTAIFFLAMTPIYWISTSHNLGDGDWTGTVALAMTFLLCGMVTGYLGFHASKMDPRPEDRDAEIADGAGELGFFPPYSWWPLWCALTLAVIVYGFAVAAWWLVIIGFGLGAVALSGWVFEFYRGEHAH